MQPSRKGLLFIAAREALVLQAYQDGAHLSIGFGSNDPALKPGDRITVKEAFKRLKKDVEARAEIVTKALTVPVLQHEFDAIFSAYYQSGTDALTDIAAAVNGGDKSAVAQAFLKHDTNAKGEPMPGLLKRRARELNLFLTGEYGDLDKIPYWKGDPKKTPMGTYKVRAGDL
jgi:GH24 family phage-related lysozyme (muramidase)